MIKDITCTNQAVVEGTACDKCRASRKELLRRCTQATNLCRNPIKYNINNCHLERAPTLLNQKIESQAESIQKLRGSYRGKLYRKWSHHNGVSVKTNSNSDAIFSDEVASNVEAFLSETVSKDSLSKYVFMKSVRKHKIAKTNGVCSVNHCPLAIRLDALKYT